MKIFFPVSFPAHQISDLMNILEHLSKDIKITWVFEFKELVLVA